MNKICNKAQREGIEAAYILGQLIIWAHGQRPTHCHHAHIEQWPFRIYPPQYQIVSCIDEGVVCTQVVANYRTAMAFSISQETLEAMGGFAAVHHRDGVDKVPINHVDVPKEIMDELLEQRAESASGMPSPFSQSGGDVPFPFRLSDLFKTGSGENIRFLSRSDVTLHTATGYSNSFSFTEAFHNAISNLPPDNNPFPDKMTTVKVTGIGATFGGIAGLSRMYITVSSFY
jgi:hypothetical protein